MNITLCVLTGLALGAAAMADEHVPLTPEQLAHHSARVAAVQMSGIWIWQGNDDEPQAIVDKVVDYIARAGADQADLVVFPELLLGKFRVPNRSTERIAEAARAHSINVAVGCFEITDDEGSYGNSTLIFDREGVIVGRYFKTHEAVGEGPRGWPPREDDPEWAMTPGPSFPVFDLDFGRIGVFTCYDGYFPEPPRILALKGAEILLWPNARGGSVEEHIVRTILQQNYVHMVCTNKDVGAGTMIAEWPAAVNEIVSEAREAYIISDLNLTGLRHARKLAREFFQRRPEIYGEILAEGHVWKYYENLPDLPDAEQYPEVRGVSEITAPLTPDTRPGTDLLRLAVMMRAPWMEGWIELRMPEVLQSNLGMHFIDHHMPGMAPITPVEAMPEWTLNERTGAISYAWTTGEGMHFSASARPYRDRVYLTATVRNDTGSPLAYVDFNPCFNFGTAPELDYQWDLTKLFAVIGGKWQPLSNTTPTPEDKGRKPWVTMETLAHKGEWQGERDTGNTWWLLDQVADHNLLATVSPDGKHLVAYSWDAEPAMLMSNCGNPCFHTGPAPKAGLDAGASHTWRGIVYFVENDPEALIERYKQDRATWNRWPKRPADTPEP
jgi:beta-ureidopropionase